MLLEIFHDNTGKVLGRGWAVVYDVDGTDILIEDRANGKPLSPLWCDERLAMEVIKTYKIKVLNRSGKCLTLLNEYVSAF